MARYNLVMKMLCLSNIPLIGQQVLARHSDDMVRAMLAANPTTDVNIINRLVHDKDEIVARNVIARTTNINAITKSFEDSNRFNNKDTADLPVWDVTGAEYLGVFVARNPAAPPELLEAALTDKRERIALTAYCNPSTPLDARRKLTPERAEQLLYHNKSLSRQEIWAFDLIANNRWMTKQAAIWDEPIRHAMTYQPDAGIKTLKTLYSLLERRTVDRHPTYRAYRGWKKPRSIVTDLIAEGFEATDMQAIRHRKFTLTDVDAIFTRDRTYPPSAALLARLVGKYGLGTLLAATSTMTVWVEREAAVAGEWSTPAIHYLTSGGAGTNKDYQAVPEICALLGNNPQHWETFIGLIPHWHGSLIDAVKTADKL